MFAMVFRMMFVCFNNVFGMVFACFGMANGFENHAKTCENYAKSYQNHCTTWQNPTKIIVFVSCFRMLCIIISLDFERALARQHNLLELLPKNSTLASLLKPNCVAIQIELSPNSQYCTKFSVPFSNTFRNFSSCS